MAYPQFATSTNGLPQFGGPVSYITNTQLVPTLMQPSTQQQSQESLVNEPIEENNAPLISTSSSQNVGFKLQIPNATKKRKSVLKELLNNTVQNPKIHVETTHLLNFPQHFLSIPSPFYPINFINNYPSTSEIPNSDIFLSDTNTSYIHEDFEFNEAKENSDIFNFNSDVSY